jgi:hypothetical protein
VSVATTKHMDPPPPKRGSPWEFQLGVDASPTALRRLRPDYVRYVPQRSPGSGRYRYRCHAFFNAAKAAPPDPNPPASDPT